MARKRSGKSSGGKDSTANLGFVAKLRLAADNLRNNMDGDEVEEDGEPFEEEMPRLVAERHAQFSSLLSRCERPGEGARISAKLEQAKANRTQSRTLATLRDTLLPKLLSGELSVTKAVISPATE